MSSGARLAVLGGQLKESARLAREQLLFTSIGGSALLPGTVRRLVFRGAGARLESSPGIGFVFAGRPENLAIGSDVYMNRGVFIEAVGPVTIGTHCAFGMEAMIVTSHHGIDERGRWDPEATGRAVTIGDRVWVGARAVILPGARVDSDTVIAAGAVVTGHCRGHGLYAGVPARRIRDFSAAPDAPAQPIR
jgi:maltose O-acetyltransferase